MTRPTSSSPRTGLTSPPVPAQSSTACSRRTATEIPARAHHRPGGCRPAKDSTRRATAMAGAFYDPGHANALRPPKGRTWARRGQTPVVRVTGDSKSACHWPRSSASSPANLAKCNLSQLTALAKPGSSGCSTGPVSSAASSPVPAWTSRRSVTPTIRDLFSSAPAPAARKEGVRRPLPGAYPSRRICP